MVNRMKDGKMTLAYSNGTVVGMLVASDLDEMSMDMPRMLPTIISSVRLDQVCRRTCPKVRRRLL